MSSAVVRILLEKPILLWNSFVGRPKNFTLLMRSTGLPKMFYRRKKERDGRGDIHVQ
jgi:hypothetical protein